MTTPVIPADVAAWIHDVVLPASFHDDISDGLREHCACQWGPCGHCQAGEHARCSVVAWGGAPPATCETYICDSRGRVAVGRGVRTAEAWLSGRPCRWVCPCGCTPVGAALPPAGPPEPIQLDLFAFAA